MPVPSDESILESLSTPCFVFSGTKSIVKSNQAFSSLTGYKKQEVLEMKVSTVLDLSACPQYSLENWPPQTPARLQLKGGGIKPVCLSVNRIVSRDQITTVPHYSVLITDFRQVAEGEGRNFIDAVFSSAVDGIIAIEESGIILAFNHAAEKMFGYTSDEVVGRNVSCLMAKHIAMKHQGFVERHLLSGERLLGRAVGRKGQLRGLRKDKALFPMSLSLSEVNDPSLERRQFVGLIHDQSILEEQRYAAEEAHRLNEIILQTSIDGIVMLDDQGHVMSMNASAEATIGITLDELRDKSLHTAFVSAQRNNMLRLLSSGRTMTSVHATFEKSGYEVILNISGFEGKASTVVCMADKTKEMDLTHQLNSIEEIVSTMSDISFNGMAEIDADGILLAMNPRLEKMVGCGSGDLVGKRLDEFVVIDASRMSHLQAEGTQYMLALCRYLKGGIGHMMDSGLGGLFRIQWRKLNAPTNCRNVGQPGMINLAKLSSVRWGDKYIAEFLDVSEKQSLQESREKYLANANLTTAIFESAVDAMLVIDTHGKIMMFNAAAERMFRWRMSDVVDKDISILMPDDIGRIHQHYVDRYLHSGEYAKGRAVGNSRKLVGKRKDGSLFAMSLTVSEIAGLDRERTFVGFIRDLTHLEKMQEELEKKTQRTMDIFDSSYDGMVVVDIEGSIQSCNVTACRMFGYTRQEALQLNANTLLRGTLTRTAEWERVKRSLGMVQGLALQQGGTCEGVTKAGKTIPCSVIIKEISSRNDNETLDSDSEPESGRMDRTFTVLFRDLHAVESSRVKLEEERKGSNDKTMIMNAIFSCATDAIILIEQGGRINAFNKGAERLFGYTAEEVIGEKIETLMPAGIAKHHQGYIDKFLKSGQQATSRAVGKNRKLEGRRKDGTVFSMTLTLNEVEDTESHTKRFVGFIRDVSVLEKLNEQLVIRNKRIEAIYNSTFDAMLTFELGGKVVHYNKAAVTAFGWKHEEIVGRSVEALFPPDAIRTLMQIPAEIMRLQQGLPGKDNDQGYSRSLLAKKKSGTLFPVHVTVSPVPYVPERANDQKNITKRQFTIVLRDLSDLHAIASQLDSERLSHGKMRMAGQLMMNALAAISNEEAVPKEDHEKDMHTRVSMTHKANAAGVSGINGGMGGGLHAGDSTERSSSGVPAPRRSATADRIASNVMGELGGLGIMQQSATGGCPVIRSSSAPTKKNLDAQMELREHQQQTQQSKRELSPPTCPINRVGLPNKKKRRDPISDTCLRNTNGKNGSDFAVPVARTGSNRTTRTQSPVQGTHTQTSLTDNDPKEPTTPHANDISSLPDGAIARIAVRLPQWSLLQFAATCHKIRDVISRLPLDWVIKPIRGGRRVKAIINCLPRLHSIKLTPDTVDWETLHDMCAFKELKKLDVSYCYITPATVNLIKGLTSLVSLDLSNSDLGVNSTTYLNSLTSLTALKLTRCGLTDSDVNFIKTTVNIKDLSLAGCPITSEGLDIVSESLTQLENLDISDTRIDMSSIAGITRITTLTSLCLAGVGNTDSEGDEKALIPLEPLQNLQSLNLDYHHKISDGNAQSLVKLNKLKSLSLTDCAVDEIGFERILSELNLKRLLLSVEGIPPWLTDSSVRAMKSQKNMTTLVVAGQELLTDAGVTDLVQSCPSLTNLDLSYTSVSDAGIATLCNLKHLHILEIYGLTVSKQVLAVLRKSIPNIQISE